MTTKVTALVATSSASRDAFTKEVLQKLVDSAPGLPVTVGFNPKQTVGVVTAARAVGEGLEVSIEMETVITSLSHRLTPKPPAPPLNKYLREGALSTCPKCGSSMLRTKMIFFGKKRCIHPQCRYEI
jgi:primosomal protein N'